jgi:hypothetical protein
MQVYVHQNPIKQAEGDTFLLRRMSPELARSVGCCVAAMRRKSGVKPTMPRQLNRRI